MVGLHIWNPPAAALPRIRDCAAIANVPSGGDGLPDQYFIDGFVSMRADVAPMAKAVQACLSSDYGLRAVMQEDLRLIYPNNHRKAQSHAINTGTFTIVVLSPEKRFEKSEGAGKVEQVHEIQEAVNVAARRTPLAVQGRFETKTYPIVFAFPEDERLTEYAAQRLIETTFVDQLEFAQFFQLTGSADAKSDAFARSVGAVCHYIASVVDPYVSEDEDNKIRPRRTDAQIARARAETPEPASSEALSAALKTNDAPAPSGSPGAAPQASRPEGSDSPVEDYLESRVRYWLAGQLGPMPDSDEEAAISGAPNSPFAFSPDRLMQLRVSIERDGPNPATGEPRREPVHERMLRPRDMRPVYLTGDAGAGKSITVTTAAAALASLHLPRVRRELERLKGFEPGGPLKAALSRAEPLVPVVLRCSEVTRKLRPHPAPSGAQLLEALSQALPDLPDFMKLIDQHPVAVFIDGLDEVVDRDLRDTFLEAVTAFRRDFETAQVKLIITSRPSDRRPFPPEFDYVRAALSPPEEAQANAFIEDYLKRYLEDDKRKITVERLRSQLKETRAATLWSDIRERPLLLNVFCWLAQDGGPSIEDSGTFCKQVVDLLLTRKPIICESAAGGSEASRTVPPDFARHILQSLAQLALTSDYGARRVPESQAFGEVNALRDDYAPAGLADLEPRAILRALELRTNLVKRIVERDATYYQVTPGLFAEYLAGENLATPAGPTARPIRSLIQVTRTDGLDTMLGPLQFAFALRMNQPDVHPDACLRIPDELVNKASGASRPQQSIKWLGAAGSIFASHPVNETGLGEPGRKSLNRILGEAVRTYQAHEPRLTPVEQAEAVDILGEFCLRSGARATLTAMDRVTAALMPGYQPWVRCPALDDDTHEAFVGAAPVLTGEYALFIEAGGGPDSIWSHAPGKSEFLISTATAQPMDEFEMLPAPRDIWHELRRHPLRPVVNICWYEAVAYARWLNLEAAEHDGEPPLTRLMTREEYRLIAATAAQGRDYVYGDDDLPQEGEQRFNCPKTGIGAPSPPGVFSDSPGLPGLYDFGSNVRSLTLPAEDDERIEWPPEPDPDDPPAPYLVGGAWNSLHTYDFRTSGPGPRRSPDERSSGTGVRLIKFVRRAVSD